jgi:hypothetical protein
MRNGLIISRKTQCHPCVTLVHLLDTVMIMDHGVDVKV